MGGSCPHCYAPCTEDAEGMERFECGCLRAWTDEGPEELESCSRESVDWIAEQVERLRASGDTLAADVICRLMDELDCTEREIKRHWRWATEATKEGRYRRTITHAKFQLQRYELNSREAEFDAAFVRLGLRLSPKERAAMMAESREVFIQAMAKDGDDTEARAVVDEKFPA